MSAAMAGLLAGLAVSLCLLGFTVAVFEDQVGKFDWCVSVDSMYAAVILGYLSWCFKGEHSCCRR